MQRDENSYDINRYKGKKTKEKHTETLVKEVTLLLKRRESSSKQNVFMGTMQEKATSHVIKLSSITDIFK